MIVENIMLNLRVLGDRSLRLVGEKISGNIILIGIRFYVFRVLRGNVLLIRVFVGVYKRIFTVNLIKLAYSANIRLLVYRRQILLFISLRNLS